jgi:hypothetical protein
MYKAKLPKRVQKWANENQDKILSIVMEPNKIKVINGVNKYPVYAFSFTCHLAAGWCCMADGSHVITAESEMLFLAEARNFLTACECDDCRQIIELQKRCAGGRKT